MGGGCSGGLDKVDSFKSFEGDVLGVWTVLTVLSVLRGYVLDVWTVLLVLGRVFWVFETFLQF